jgi:hypothetical protein
MSFLVMISFLGVVGTSMGASCRATLGRPHLCDDRGAIVFRIIPQASAGGGCGPNRLENVATDDERHGLAGTEREARKKTVTSGKEKSFLHGFGRKNVASCRKDARPGTIPGRLLKYLPEHRKQAA